MNSTGEVGINDNSPSTKLDITGPGTAAGVTLRLNDQAALAPSRHIQLARGSVSAYIGIRGDEPGDPMFLTRSGNNEDIAITSSGDVGIGTHAPTGRLTIFKDTNPYLYFLNSATGVGENSGFSMVMAGSDMYMANREGGVLSYEAPAGSEHFRITGIGTVVMGDVTQSLSYMQPCILGMSHGNATGNYMELGGTNRNANGISKVWTFRHGYWGGSKEVASIAVETNSSSGGAGSGYASIIFNTGSSGNGDSGSNSTERLKIDYNGILYSTPTYSNTTSNAANVSMPNSDGQFFRSTSSIKYKDNVTTLTDALADKILECRPVSYTSKCTNDDNTKINYGLIAEEVNAIDPSLVFLDDGEPEGVQYDRFVPHLINLVKRLEKRLTDAGL